MYYVGFESIPRSQFSCSVSSKISNTRRCVSSEILTLRNRLFLKEFRGVWMDETHFRVFDMASQIVLNNFWRNSRLKLAKFYGN